MKAESESLALKPSGLQSPPRDKSTGPRSEMGKQISSRNATKHGVLSKVLLLKGESKAEYQALLTGLREALKPVGAFEDLLVEKVATIIWRQRRLLLAEGGEIQKAKESLEWDEPTPEHEEAENSVDSLPLSEGGVIEKISSPVVLEGCLELLAELQGQIEEYGLTYESDTDILEKVYGGRLLNKRVRKDLYDRYQIWHRTLEAEDEEGEPGDSASPEQCKENILREIKKEIRRLRGYQKQHAYVEARRKQLAAITFNVLGLDHLLRYETHLNRELDRTLSQLERLQRMRPGHPVPPRLEIDMKVDRSDNI